MDKSTPVQNSKHEFGMVQIGFLLIIVEHDVDELH